MSKYWSERIAKAQAAKYNKNRKEIDKMIRKQYQNLSKQVIEDFESTYNKLLATIEEGKEPTPADLYKLDKYWKMQSQLDQKLTKLGRKQIALLTKHFRTQFYDVYNAINIKGLKLFNTINDAGVMQVINQIWCSDGKSWSQRIWNNTQLLKQTLEDELIHCVVTGKKTSQLKKVLQERFNVSYSQADMLARTELCHIQSEAAKQRYQDYGITKVQWWAEKDERQCPSCGKLHKKIYPVGASIPIPNHPNCRCQIIPVVDVPELDTNE